MRLSHLWAALAIAILAIVTGATSAQAFGDRDHRVYGERTVRHWVYRPSYRHVYRTHTAADPYAYRYEPRGYYPYYNSGYWRPARVVRKRYLDVRFPRYYSGWGANSRTYNHRGWHDQNHGRHRLHHW